MAQHRGQGQERGAGLDAIHRLGEGGRSGQEPQGYRLLAAGLGHNRDPEGGIEAFGLAGIHVVAEQVEAAIQGHIQVGGRVGTARSREGGEQNSRSGDQLRVVVVDHQHLIQAPRQGSHGLGAQHRLRAHNGLRALRRWGGSKGWSKGDSSCGGGDGR